MKNIFSLLVVVCMAIFAISCDHDLNEGFDISSPQASIPVDTFEVNKGETVQLKAMLSDESGLESTLFSYPAWKVSEENKLRESGYPTSYEFTFDVLVPQDAAISWLEDYQKHDGATFKITQTYHKLSLTFYDRVKNKNVVYFYVKVRP